MAKKAVCKGNVCLNEEGVIEFRFEGSCDKDMVKRVQRQLLTGNARTRYVFDEDQVDK